MNLNKQIRIITLGCKVNQYESEKIRSQFTQNGYITSDDECVDVCIINSCTVTHIADKKTRSVIRKIKRNNPQGIVAVTGCYVQTNMEELMLIPEIDILVDNTKKEKIYELIESYRGKKIISKGDIFKEDTFSKSGKLVSIQEKTRGYIKIQDGCNNFCSYCKIPFARGKSRSRKLSEIISEAQELERLGYKEVVIIGINLAQYGLDIGEVTLEDVIVTVSKLEGIKRIRVGSIYPEQITDEFLKIFNENPKMMPHVHLSLQSCCDGVLKEMHRNYFVSEIEKKLTALNEIQNMRVTADIIVGFPTEGESEYLECYQFIEKSCLSECHLFPYSKREKTKAAGFVSQSTHEIVNERSDRLLKLSKDKLTHYSKNMVGKSTSVLIEKIEKNNAVGYSDNYLKVKIVDISSEIQENTLVEVEIIDYIEILIGKIVVK
ncbi:MAG: tRNA (N(6)-L-threonylcarbamoyladenosine(37)-C(2))-methylthiotransferase MtaB [Fusobacteria bacterium]|nr:tRNA (N(6)-L-threonylcarbamoyladenosine(37)-C(2))-methylthiotransferase MtaB [Fusobacteriota bacterium]